jgi:hypothetical protein
MADLYRVRTVITPGSGAAPMLATHYWTDNSLAPAVAALEMTARVRAFWNYMAGQVNAGNTFQVDGQVDTFDPATGSLTGSVGVTTPAVVNGTGSGDELPRQTQLLIRYNTGAIVNGRRLKGRTFVPLLTEAANSLGLPNISIVNVGNAAAILLGTTITSVVSQSVWHRPNLSGAGGSAPVTSRSVSNQWASQRSRRF